MSEAILGIDIGGTFIKGVVIEKNEIKYRSTVETHDNQDQWQQGTRQIVNDLINNTHVRIIGVGLAAPGITDEQNRSIKCMPGRLQGLENLDWSSYLGQDVHVINDAHAALFSESRWGAAKDVPNVVMLTLGTGVGGGLMINGQLVQGFLHRTGHFGHISIDSSKEIRDDTGIPGTLEEAFGEATLPQRSLGKFNTSQELVEAYVSGDTWATYVWLTSLRKLALGMVSLCNAISPDVIVLAGGITKAGEHLLNPLSTFMELYEWRIEDQATPIKLAEFKEFAGAIGAALFASSRILNH